jgi:hypothetical protein
LGGGSNNMLQTMMLMKMLGKKSNGKTGSSFFDI